jgi:hypothetical protein
MAIIAAGRNRRSRGISKLSAGTSPAVSFSAKPPPVRQRPKRRARAGKRLLPVWAGGSNTAEVDGGERLAEETGGA